MRENKEIKGITVWGNEIKISQYADDTNMTLDGSKKSFSSALLNLQVFGAISGLQLSLTSRKQNSLDWGLRWASR